MSKAKRKFPRVPVNYSATMAIAVDFDGHNRWAKTPVTVCSATCEGLGIRLNKKTYSILKNGARVVIKLPLKGQIVELPAKVCWHSANGGESFDFGVKFDMALAPAKSRQLYSSWVVALIVAHRDQQQNTGAKRPRARTAH